MFVIVSIIGSMQYLCATYHLAPKFHIHFHRLYSISSLCQTPDIEETEYTR